MLVGESGTLFGEELFGLGQATPAEMAVQAWPVLVQAKDYRGVGVPGVKFRILDYQGNAYDQDVTQGNGYAALYAQVGTVPLPYVVEVVSAPFPYAMPANTVVKGTAPRVTDSDFIHRTFNRAADRQKVIDATARGYGVLGSRAGQEVAFTLQYSGQAVAEAEARQTVAEKAAEEAEARVMELMDQARAREEEEAGAEILAQAEAELREAERVAAARAQEAADAAAAVAAMKGGEGITPYLPYILGGAVVVGVGLVLYLTLKK